jgi:hypothetical protein
MANLNMVSGLSPTRYGRANTWTGGGNLYCILAADTNQYWIGDPVTTIGNAGADTKGIPAVTLGVAGTATRGVIMAIGTLQYGPYINPNNLNQLTTRPAGAQAVNYYAFVQDDPDVFFEIQEAGVGSVLTSSSVNRNVNYNLGTRTSTLTISPCFLDNNTVNTTSTLNLKIISAVQRLDNTPFAQYQKWIVTINNHEFSGGTTSP